MTHVLSSAAYVRKVEPTDQSTPHGQSASHAVEVRSSVLEEQVWVLLETPQTVESLMRAVETTARGNVTKVDRSQFEKMLERLLDADLIEVSPDS